jgi:hypothetical protein
MTDRKNIIISSVTVAVEEKIVENEISGDFSAFPDA